MTPQQQVANTRKDHPTHDQPTDTLQELSALLKLYVSEVDSELSRRSSYASKHIPLRKNYD